MMKAVQYVSRGQVELVEVPVPSTSSDHVLIRVEKVTICGSDLHLLYASSPESYPFQPGMSGHECVGTVAQSSLPQVNRGDQVLIIPPDANALVEYLAIGPYWLIPLPKGLDLEQAILAQQLGTVIFCCRKLANVLDKNVVIVGQGPAGLMFSTLLYHLGAKRIIGLDILEHRLSVAEHLGATHTLNVSEVDPVTALQEITHGRMADVVIEASGAEEAINLCPDLARPGGELALFGVSRTGVVSFAYEKFLRQQLRIITSIHTQAEPDLRSFRLALDFINQDRLDLSPLITHRFPLADAHGAFQLAETKQDGVVKVLIDFEKRQ